MDELTIVPHLSFRGNCEEALQMYMEAFGGEIFYLSRWSENTFDRTPEQIGKVMHAEFRLGTTRMAASDGFDGESLNTDVKFMVRMDSKAKALHTIEVLSQSGTVLSPLRPHPAPDDSGCGSITRDRYGYTWIITCPNPDKC